MQPEKENPKLLFISGINEGEQVQIQGKVCVIGRDPSADISLDSPFVSRHHAEIRSEGVYWTIADLFSKNGVFRNKARIEPGEPLPLHNNDEIQIGSVCMFRFLDPEDTLLESDMQMRTPGVWLDELNREVYVHNNKLDPPLSQQQFDLLAVLFHHQREVVTNEMIADASGREQLAASRAPPLITPSAACATGWPNWTLSTSTLKPCGAWVGALCSVRMFEGLGPASMPCWRELG